MAQHYHYFKKLPQSLIEMIDLKKKKKGLSIDSHKNMDIYLLLGQATYHSGLQSDQESHKGFVSSYNCDLIHFSDSGLG